MKGLKVIPCFYDRTTGLNIFRIEMTKELLYKLYHSPGIINTFPISVQSKPLTQESEEE